jgi:hypothetical protein
MPEVIKGSIPVRSDGEQAEPQWKYIAAVNAGMIGVTYLLGFLIFMTRWMVASLSWGGDPMAVFGDFRLWLVLPFGSLYSLFDLLGYYEFLGCPTNLIVVAPIIIAVFILLIETLRRKNPFLWYLATFLVCVIWLGSMCYCAIHANEMFF